MDKVLGKETKIIYVGIPVGFNGIGENKITRRYA